MEAANRVVEAVFAEPEVEEEKIANPSKHLSRTGAGDDWEPSWAPQAVLPGQKSMYVIDSNGR